MVRLFVRHDVADFDVWYKGYAENAALRDGGGVRSASVYRSVTDGNDVTVSHDFDSAEAAQAFMAMPELKEAMDSIGVIGAPTIWITQEA